MKDRVRELRKSLGLNQTDFGKAVGVSLSAVQKWESGENVLSDAVILLICQKFSVSETWLRTGSGEMHRGRSKAEEMGDLVGALMSQRPDSFKSAVVSTLLRFDPDGDEWEILEKIYKNISEELSKK